MDIKTSDLLRRLFISSFPWSSNYYNYNYYIVYKVTALFQVVNRWLTAETQQEGEKKNQFLSGDMTISRVANHFRESWRHL